MEDSDGGIVKSMSKTDHCILMFAGSHDSQHKQYP